MKTRYDEILEAVNKFHAEHPEVWELFVQFTFDRIRKGFKHFGVDVIFGRIRWETPLGDDGKLLFKINNNFKAFYARGFMLQYPEHEGFFRTREMTSQNIPAIGRPELGPYDYDYTDETNTGEETE